MEIIELFHNVFVRSFYMFVFRIVFKTFLFSVSRKFLSIYEFMLKRFPWATSVGNKNAAKKSEYHD